MIFTNPDDMYRERRANALALVWVKHGMTYANILNGFPERWTVILKLEDRERFDDVFIKRRMNVYGKRDGYEDMRRYERSMR